jgi:hypothetical protein
MLKPRIPNPAMLLPEANLVSWRYICVSSHNHWLVGLVRLLASRQPCFG